MSDPTDAGKKAKGGGSTRIRSSIYGERKTITVRMSADLNGRLIGYCNSVRTPANTYVNGLIENILDKDPPINLGRAPARTTSKVVVTIRIEPGLHHRLKDYCTTKAISANALICFLLQRNLAAK
jgi:hypothetical protein